jgi:hypothetical protein
MQKLQLYIEGQRLDLFEDETVSLTQSIQNIKDPSYQLLKLTIKYSNTTTIIIL